MKNIEIFDVVETNSFIINPQIIGKGSFKDLKKLRQTIVKEFDFEKLELTQKFRIKSSYTGLMKL